MIVITTVSPPADSLVAASLPRIDYADAYRGSLPAGRRYSLDQAVALVFATAPGWVAGLMRLRDALVRPLGLKVDRRSPAARPDGPLMPGAQLGIFRVLGRRPDELLLGEDDRHLDFRVSLLLREEGGRQTATVTTAVRFHNGWGRAYFAVVRPVHRRIVPAMLRRALSAAQASRPRPQEPD